MHKLTLPERLELRPDEIIEAGQYVCENISGAQLLNLCGDGEMEVLKETRPFDEKKDWNGKKILIVRVGGYGDIVLMTPVFREIHRRWPKAKVHVASMGTYGTVLEGLPFVDKILKYPVAVKDAETYDAWIFLENAIENNPRAEKLHMTDLFAEIVGLSKTDIGKAGIGFSKLDWTPEKMAAYVVTPDEASWARVQYPRKPGIRRLCIQPTASAHCRVYPFEKLSEVVNAFKAKKEWEVYLLGQKGEIQMQELDNVHNLAAASLTFRQSCAVVAQSDIFLGNDSAIVHVAGALGLPAVALYGPFPWKLRTAYAPTTYAIQGSGKCAPCYFHEKRGTLKKDPFPKDCPSRERGLCQVLESIKPDTIVSKIEKLAKPLSLAAI